MPATLDQLAARLAALEDKEAIRRLKARYLRACDLKQVETVRDSFAPGPIRIAYDNFPEFYERDAFVAVYSELACSGGVYDLHHATNWEIDLVGADEATGLWSLNFRSILTGPRQVVRLVVEYEDRYRRENGRWWIVETVSRITSSLVEQISEDGTVTVAVLAAPPAA